LVTLFISVTSLGALRLHAADEELVAVMDLAPQAARPEEALAITNQLRTQLLKTGKFILVDRSQMAAILDEQAFQQAGCTSEECAVQVGKLLGVRKIISGSVTKLSEQLWQVSVLMLDVETAKTLRAETETYEGNLVTVIRAGVPDLAARLAGAAGPLPQQAAITVPQSGTAFRDPTTGMEFVYVPGGEYEQGCHPGNGGECDDDEKPARQVRLSPFWMAKTEVTVAQFRQFANDSGYRTEAEQIGGCYYWTGEEWKQESSKTWRNPGFSQDDRHPVTCVSWNDAQAFIRWLAQKSGQSYRLPAEAEWEYACRDAGKPVKYAWGDGEPRSGGPALGNIADEQSGLTWRVKGYNDGHARTSPVGSFPANGLGLSDMTGNVWEWVQDIYNDKAYHSGATTDPIYQGSGARRVLRGGGWDDFPRFVRCSDRVRLDPGIRYAYLGFRLARTK
jgi:formylglycine-generating enzyme required for sulfatase activity